MSFGNKIHTEEINGTTVRKKRIIQEVVIKIEMTGGYMDTDEYGNEILNVGCGIENGPGTGQPGTSGSSPGTSGGQPAASGGQPGVGGGQLGAGGGQPGAGGGQSGTDSPDGTTGNGETATGDGDSEIGGGVAGTGDGTSSTGSGQDGETKSGQEGGAGSIGEGAPGQDQEGETSLGQEGEGGPNQEGECAPGQEGETGTGDNEDNTGNGEAGTGQEGENTTGEPGSGNDGGSQNGSAAETEGQIINGNDGDPSGKDNENRCSEILRRYVNKPEGSCQADQNATLKCADRFISTGPNLERVTATSECQCDDKLILQYQNACTACEDESIPDEMLEFDENNLVRINWRKVKKHLRLACPSRKLKLLQALRQRLSSNDSKVQLKTSRDMAKHDLFELKSACCPVPLLDELMWPRSVSLPHPVQNTTARLLNALVSLENGREYLKDISVVITLTWGRSLRSIVEHSAHPVVDTHTGNMLISAMMKLSLFSFQRKDMIRKGLLRWLVANLTDMEQQQNFYHLEFATALLMMLLTHPNATEFLIDQIRSLLAFFVRILKLPGNTSWPYIRMSMLLLFRNPKIASNAKQLNLPGILQDFLSMTNDQTEKQGIQDVLNQLENPASVSLEEIEKNCKVLAEDKVYMDAEIDKEDPVDCFPDIGGEELLKYKFACKKRRNSKPNSSTQVSPTDPPRRSKCPKQSPKDKQISDPKVLTAYNEVTHTFELVPNKDAIFNRTEGAGSQQKKPSKELPKSDMPKNKSPSIKTDNMSTAASILTNPAGQDGKSVGPDGKSVGQDEKSVGPDGKTPIKGAINSGQKDTTPGPKGKTPGTNGKSPAQAMTTTGPDGKTLPQNAANSSQRPSGQSAKAPGQNGITPGQEGKTPAQETTTPGQNGKANVPGQNGKNPGQKGKGSGQNGKPSGQKSVAGQPNKDSLLQNVEITQTLTSPNADASRVSSEHKLLDGVRISSGKLTKIYSDPTINITATKISPNQDPAVQRPGLNFNIRPLRNNERNRTLKIVCNTDTEQTENFSCTVFELNGDGVEEVQEITGGSGGTATIVTTRTDDGSIHAVVNQTL